MFGDVGCGFENFFFSPNWCNVHWGFWKMVAWKAYLNGISESFTCLWNFGFELWVSWRIQWVFKMWTWSVSFVLCIAEAIWRLKIHDNQEGGGVAQASPYPARPGEPDCLFYRRTGLCGYGSNCRFNHPAYAAQVIHFLLTIYCFMQMWIYSRGIDTAWCFYTMSSFWSDDHLLSIYIFFSCLLHKWGSLIVYFVLESDHIVFFTGCSI